MKAIYLILSITLLFFLSSCATTPKYVAEVNPDYTVAVLPLYNTTNDIDGPVLVREVFNKKIQRYYKTKSLKEIDRILRDQMGINLGGQLDLTTPQKLGEVLGVDAVIYGYLLNFDDITTIAYNARKVRAGFKMVDTMTGRTIWARGQGVRSITGMVEAQPATERLTPFRSIKEIEKIPGINEWYDIVNLPEQAAASGDARSALAIEALAAMSTVLSFGVHFFGNIFDIHLITETRVMTNRIVDSIGEGKKSLSSVEPKVPRLIFPAYLVFADKNFSAVMMMTTVLRSTQDSVTRRIELLKLGNNLRSNRLTDDKLSVIIKRDEKKGYILDNGKGRFIKVDLDDPHLQKTEIIKEFVEDVMVDNHPCEKYRVIVIYGDWHIQEGFVWEAKDMDGFVIKVSLRDNESKVMMDLKDINLGAPPASAFDIPDSYTEAIVY